MDFAKFCALVGLPLLLGSCAGDSQSPESPDVGATAVAMSVESVSPEEAARLIQESSEIVVLDIRTPEEFAEGHVAGAMNIDFRSESFAEDISKLDPGTPVVLHCRSGNRSGQSLPTLEKVGFEEIYHLEAGFNGWQASNLPVATE